MDIDRVTDHLKVELLTAFSIPDGVSASTKTEMYLRMAYVAGMEQAINDFRGRRSILWISDGIVKRRFISMQQAADYLEIPVQGIRDVVAGNQHTVRGLKFKYAT